MRLLRIVLLLGLFSIAFFGCAKNDVYPAGAGKLREPNTVSLSEASDAQRQVLGAEVGLFEDPTGALTFPDVRARTFVTHGAGVPILGYTSSTWWFQIRLRNDTQEAQRRFLEVGWPRLNELVVYAEQGTATGGPAERYSSGWLKPFSERTFAHPAHQFPLTFAPGEERLVYIKVKSASELILPIAVHAESELAYRTLIGLALSFLYCGCLLGLGLYHLVLAFRLKHAHHFLYAGQVGFFVFYSLLVSGYFGVFEPLLVLGENLVSITRWGWLYFHVAFARSFLNTRSLVPRFDRSLGVAQNGIIPISAILDLQFLEQRQAEVLLGPLAPFFVMVVLLAAVACMRRGGTTASWYVYAQSLLALGLVLAGLIFSGMIGVHPGFAGSMILLSTLAELVVLSIALSEQMRVLAMQQASALRELQAGRLSALRQLVASVTHELNSPLGSLNSSADSLGRVSTLLSKESLDDDRRRKVLGVVPEAVGTIHAASKRLSRIVQSLKDFSGLDGPERQLHNLNTGLDAALELLEKRLAEVVEIVRDYQDLPPLYCSASAINQALLHLLSNAADALDGSGTLTLKTRATREWIEITIQDNGRGMTENQLASVLSPGLSNSGRRVHMGLGLPTSRRIVEDHGGSLTLQSELGSGTTVKLRFPRKAPPSQSSAPSSA